jgi:hypothetical protein
MAQLRAEGCTCFQGYLFGKPVPADERITMLGLNRLTRGMAFSRHAKNLGLATGIWVSLAARAFTRVNGSRGVLARAVPEVF